MAARRVNRLYDLDIDEVSHVDRPANQHGAVVIAKRAAEDQRMAMYDSEGYELDEDLLEPGDEAFDEEGNQYVMVDDDQAQELADAGLIDFDEDSYYEPEYAGVGKAASSELLHLPGRGTVGRATGSVRERTGSVGFQAGGRRDRLKGSARSAKARGERYLGNAGRAGVTRGRVAAGGGIAAAGGGGYMLGDDGKKTKSASLGNDVFEQLSKALRGNEAQEAVSKLAELVEDSRQDAQDAWEVAKALADERDYEEYVELASTYNVAADPYELGGVLARVAKNSADADDIAYLDRVLSAEPVTFDEVGYSGYAENSVMDQVSAIAGQAVGKRGDLSHEEAVVALFDANADAYELYLEEQKG